MASPTVDFKKQVEALSKALKKLGQITKPNIKTLEKLALVIMKNDVAQENLTEEVRKSAVVMRKDAEKAVKAYSKQLEKSRIAIIKEKDALEKTHSAAIKENATRKKRIDTQRKAMNQSEAVRKNLLLKAEALKKVKQQQDLDIHNNQRSNAANIKYEKTLRRVNRSLFSFTKATASASTGVHHLRNASDGAGMKLSVLRSKLLIVAFGANLLSRTIGGLVRAYGQQEAAEMKVKATLSSTGMAAGITFREIKKLTQELQRNGVIGDETNLQMASLMLTYDKIGRESFPAAMKAANDMATSLAMGIPTAEELKSTVTMLSKALQDPERGMTALRKVGFSLNATQERQVKTFVHLGKTAKAQNVILKASEKQYGDMAKVIASSTLGQLNAMNMAMGDMSEVMGQSLAPVMINFADGLKFLAENLDPSTVRGFTISLVALSAAFGVSRVTASLMAFDLKVVAAKAAGAAISIDQATRAQARFNAVAAVNPYILIGMGIASLIPLVMGLEGAFKTAKDEAQDFADAQLDIINNIKILDSELAKEVAAKAYKREKEELDRLSNAHTDYRTITESYTKVVGGQLIQMHREVIESFTMLGDQTEMSHETWFKLIEDQEALVEKYKKTMIALNKVPKLLSSEEQHVQKLTKSYQDKQAVLDIQIGAYDTFMKKAFGLNRAEDLNLKTQLNLQKAASSLNISLQQLKDTYPELEKVIGDVTEAQQTQNLELQRAQEIAKLQAEIRSEAFNLMNHFADAEIAKQDEVMKNDIADIKKTSAYKRAQKRGDNAAMAQLEKEAMKATYPDRKKAAQQSLALAIADIAVSTSVAIMKSYKQLGPVAGNVPAALMAVLGGVQIAAAVKANPIPEFQRGGLIGGRRHSSGGTMINAEQGEFVMSRSAVQSVGLESLNRMNEGGGGGANITLNISAPLIDDTVVDTIIPAINEAIRRGETLATS